jgi:hypothetical protein
MKSSKVGTHSDTIGSQITTGVKRQLEKRKKYFDKVKQKYGKCHFEVN